MQQQWGGSFTKGASKITNKIALVMALMFIALFVADYAWLDWGLPVFLGKKFLSLLNFLAFWR